MPTLPGLLLAGCCALTGCGTMNAGGSDASADPAGSAPAASLGPRTYRVTGITQGGEPRELVRGSAIRLTFADGRVAIRAGCNTMSGTTTLDGTRLTVGDLASTELGCDVTLMEQDAWVAHLFTHPVQFTTADDAAIISGDVVLALQIDEEEHPAQRPAAPAWATPARPDRD